MKQLLLLLFTTLAISVSAQVQLPYQGNIADTTGNGFDGTYDFDFEIRDKSGVVLWTSGTLSLEVHLGSYSVVLGRSPQPGIPDTLFKQDSLELLISFDDGVNGRQTLAPPVDLLHVPYAVRAHYADMYCGDSLYTQYIFSSSHHVDSVITKIVRTDSIWVKIAQVDTLIVNVICAKEIKVDDGAGKEIVLEDGKIVVNKNGDKTEIDGGKISSDSVMAGEVKAGGVSADSVNAGRVNADNVKTGNLMAGGVMADSVKTNKITVMDPNDPSKQTTINGSETRQEDGLGNSTTTGPEGTRYSDGLVANEVGNNGSTITDGNNTTEIGHNVTGQTEIRNTMHGPPSMSAGIIIDGSKKMVCIEGSLKITLPNGKTVTIGEGASGEPAIFATDGSGTEVEMVRLQPDSGSVAISKLETDMIKNIGDLEVCGDLTVKGAITDPTGVFKMQIGPGGVEFVGVDTAKFIRAYESGLLGEDPFGILRMAYQQLKAAWEVENKATGETTGIEIDGDKKEITAQTEKFKLFNEGVTNVFNELTERLQRLVDAAGTWVKEKTASGVKETTTDNATGNEISQSTDPANKEVKIEGVDDLIITTPPTGKGEAIIFFDDANDNSGLTFSDKQTGNTVTHEYDVNDRLIRTDLDGDGIPESKFDETSNDETNYEIRSDDSFIRTGTIATGGKIEAGQFSSGKTITYEYDAGGNRTIRVDAEGNETRHEYDANDRIIEETKTENQSGNTIRYWYDGDDNSEGVSGANSYEQENKTEDQRTRYFYDANNNLVTETYEDDNTGKSVIYEYDLQERTVRMDVERVDVPKLRLEGGGGTDVDLVAPTGAGTPFQLVLPIDAGTSGQVLKTDGSGNLFWSGVGGGGDFQSDGSVPMAGDLDLGGNSLINGAQLIGEELILADPNNGNNNGQVLWNTNELKIIADDGVSAPTVRLRPATNDVVIEGNSVKVEALAVDDVTIKPHASTTTFDLFLPQDAGSNGEVLTTDGAGNLSFTSPGAAPTGPAGGDLSGSYPNPTIAPGAISGGSGGKISDNTITSDDIAPDAITSSELASSGVTAGSFGSGTMIPQLTLDADGRVTVASEVAVTGDDLGNHTATQDLDLNGNNLIGGVQIEIQELQLTSANPITVKAPGAATMYDFILPIDGGSNGQALKTDGTGSTSWGDVGDFFANGSVPMSGTLDFGGNDFANATNGDMTGNLGIDGQLRVGPQSGSNMILQENAGNLERQISNGGSSFQTIFDPGALLESTDGLLTRAMNSPGNMQLNIGHDDGIRQTGIQVTDGNNGNFVELNFDPNANQIGTPGNFFKGGGSFKIDHPQDPYNKYLYHSFVESPDMMNIYNGNIVTDSTGYATVEMPGYFEALNRDFRYQLTVIGSFAQAIVSEEIVEGQFVIQTSQPNVKVSWQVTGVRQDDFANENRIPVVAEKSEEEKGTRLYYPQEAKH